ncbi:M23 family metallopeptidase [Saccharopolyspora cebuensis]|uniref:M23 family metallopeptidase n=1 Tax=Saccharopolyspora cebuensis TaxID=418759 RepID=A0ABV4CPL2_9PSEU
MHPLISSLLLVTATGAALVATPPDPGAAPPRPAYRAVDRTPAGATTSGDPPGGTSSRTAQRFGWPLVPATAVRPFDPPAHQYGPGHRGVDLAGRPGQPVLAAGDGTVLFAGEVAGRPVVSIGHRGGLRTTYEPVRPLVAVGDRVARGRPIGHLEPGHPGCAAAACLHWGARRDATYYDPLALLGAGRVRLLPW